MSATRRSLRSSCIIQFLVQYTISITRVQDICDFSLFIQVSCYSRLDDCLLKFYYCSLLLTVTWLLDDDVRHTPVSPRGIKTWRFIKPRELVFNVTLFIFVYHTRKITQYFIVLVKETFSSNEVFYLSFNVSTCSSGVCCNVTILTT